MDMKEKRLIDSNELIKWIDDSVSLYGGTYSTDMLNMFGLFKHIINNTPTAEPICPYLSDNEVMQPCIEAPCEKPQGEWIEAEPHSCDLENGIDFRIECSVCHEPNSHYSFDKYNNISGISYYRTNFCPNCGARMLKEQ